jgi:hypothetical protein
VYVSVIMCDLETSVRGVLGLSGAVTPQKTAHGTLVVAFFWVRRTHFGYPFVF